MALTKNEAFHHDDLKETTEENKFLLSNLRPKFLQKEKHLKIDVYHRFRKTKLSNFLNIQATKSSFSYLELDRFNTHDHICYHPTNCKQEVVVYINFSSCISNIINEQVVLVFE